MINSRTMPRKKYQRPEVYATGTREKLWKIEYREYFLDSEGKEHSRHKSKTWSRKDYTKGEAQKIADAFMAQLQGSPAKPDGEMTLARFYEACYLPPRKRRWTGQTEATVNSLWTNHIQPAFGATAINSITKVAIEMHLGEMADAGLTSSTINDVLVRLRSILEYAVENDVIPKNPAKKLEPPPAAESVDTRSLTEDEARSLLVHTEGRERKMWRLLLGTGLRISELVPLESSDVIPDGLRVNKALVLGVVKLPKRNKARTVPLPPSLRAELLSLGDGLLFPGDDGRVMSRSSHKLMRALESARQIIPDITFRMCRTTFATLFDGEDADRTSIMGHFDEKFTNEAYRKPLADRRQKAVEKLDKRLNLVRIDRKRA